MNFLISLFKKSVKGDNFRANATPSKYNDSIAQLNSTGDQQYDKLTTEKIRKIGKTKAVTSDQTQGNTTIPGTS